MRIVFMTLTAALGGFLFGFDSGVINGTVASLQSSFQSDSVGTGFNVASMLLGCAIGALFAGTLADRHGRKTVLLATAIAFIVSAWGSGIANSSPEFVFYRILGGLAVGAASIICPAYIAEIAPAKIRGRLIAVQQLMIVLGLSASFFNNYLIARWAGSPDAIFHMGYAAWRWMFWAELLPSVLFLLALLLIPESPRYLVAAGKVSKAVDILRKIGHSEDADEKVLEIQQTLKKDHRPHPRDLINPVTRRLHPIVWIGIGLAILQQLGGINVVFYYGAVLWQSAGFSASDALFTNVVSGAVNIVGTLIAMALIDRIGRRPLLIFGSIGMIIALGILALIFSRAGLAEDGTLLLSANSGLTALIAANTFVFFFAVSWGAVMWVLLGEIFPNQYRGAALALAGLALWLTNFGITMSFPIFLSAIGLGGAYSLYTLAAVLSLFFVLKFIKETKGRTLESLHAEP